jgi:hypothetical protein
MTFLKECWFPILCSILACGYLFMFLALLSLRCPEGTLGCHCDNKPCQAGLECMPQGWDEGPFNFVCTVKDAKAERNP